jgi:hypothetical protein
MSTTKRVFYFHFFRDTSNLYTLLVEAVMSENNFSGSIPSEVANLSELRKLAAMVVLLGVAAHEEICVSHVIVLPCRNPIYIERLFSLERDTSK